MPKMKTSKVDAVIGARIQKEREAQDMTLDELSKKIGISTSMMHHYETGRARLYVSRLLEIAKALKKGVYFFLTGRDL